MIREKMETGSWRQGAAALAMLIATTFVQASPTAANASAPAGNSWVVGQVAPLSGDHALQGRAYQEGMRIAFEKVNQAGGVQGLPIRLLAADDAGDPKRTLELTKRLLQEHKPAVLAGFIGNGSLQVIDASGMLRQSGVSLVGYRADNVQLLQSPDLFNSRASVLDEAAKISSHLATVGITQLGFVYDDRDDSEILVQLIREAISPAGARMLFNGQLKSDGLLTREAVEQLMRQRPQGVLVMASTQALAKFVMQYRRSGGTGQIYATSQVDVEQLASLLPPEQMAGLMISQVVPTPYRISMRLNREFREAVSQFQPPADVPVSFAMMEGYVNGKVLIEAMRRANKLSPEALTQALRQVQNVDLGDYWVGFRPGYQTGSTFVDMTIVNSSGRISH